MALSVQKDRSGPDWPLGFVKVVTSGVPVSLMVNIDPSGVNSPGNATTTLSAEYTPVVRSIAIQAMMPNNNNSGTQPTTGNIYLMRAAAGGNGNLTDYGSIVRTIPPGAEFFFPEDGAGQIRFSPYRYSLDADVSGEGGMCLMYSDGC